MTESEDSKLDRNVRPGRIGRTAGVEAPAAAEGRDASIRDLGQTLREGKWVIALVLTVSVAAAAGYLFITPPTYRAEALIQIEPRPDLPRHLEDLTALMGPRTRTAGQVEILRSRLVIGTALDRLGWDVQVQPRWFPVVGQALAGRHAGDALAAPPFGLSWLAPFAWGGERLTVQSLRVPRELLGRPLTLTALGDDRYRLTGEDGATLLEGQVNAAASAGSGADDERLEILVTGLAARPGTRFEVKRFSRPQLVEQVSRRLVVAERGTGSDVISVAFEAPSATEAAALVAAVSSAYMQLDAETGQAEVRRTLAFLDTQLPALKANLDAAENALSRYRERQGSVDLGLEAKAAIDRTFELDRTLDGLIMRRAELAHRYAETYPEVLQLDKQIAAARAEREALLTRKTTMPAAQLGSTRLMRSVEMAGDLYLTLLKRSMELQVVKSGRTGSARMIDWPAIPQRPVRPVPGLVLGLGALLGLFGGVAAALGRRAMDHNAEDPRDIEEGTGLPVYVTIPHSAREVALQRSAGRGARVPLALTAPDDVATEMLRTLRTSLSFVLKARGKVVVVSSPSAGVGKSFVCANLAHLIAAAGQKVLLVDADLRQGRLHRYFSADRGPGLSDVLGGGASLEDAVKATGTPGLELLPRGEPASNPAELLARPRLAEILATAASRYDVVLVDTPPILAVTDALLAARSASVNLLVLRARQHPVPEIADALELFARSGLVVHGGILNDARPGGTYTRTYARRTQAALEPAHAAG